MKKTVCFIFAVLMMLSCFEFASAEDSPSFNRSIPCVSVQDWPELLAWWTATDDHYGGIYIYHNVTTKVKKKHNNLFVVEGSADYTNQYFEKWCTPGVNRKYKCSQITPRETIYVSARGNTYYHDDNSSITRINVKGSVGWKK